MNAYIHIPFCKSKCHYCSFISFPNLELKEKYIKALIHEIQDNYNGEILNTLYFGGGTPSLLTLDEFSGLLNLFNTTKKTEITAELNPESTDREYLYGLKQIGINRVSFGCQTFDDNILKQIGRRHCAKDVEYAVKRAFNAGFENINLDFIYGLPNQTIKGFEDDLKHAINLGIQHISLYGLKIEEGCYFYKNYPENLPDEDLQADMYLKAVEIMKNNDFEHYEISNFSKHGFNSQHNLNYWNNNNYYGFGAAAHGYQGNVRYFNTSDLKKYIAGEYREESHKLTVQEQLEEEIFLGFRKLSGINIEKINKKFKINFEEKYKKILQKYSNYLTRTQNGYCLNTDGILISNAILAEFLQ